jgi:hypothetical protein
MALHPVMANVILSAMACRNPTLGDIVEKSKEALKAALLELGVPPTLKCKYGLDQPYLSTNTATAAGASLRKGGEINDDDDNDHDDDDDDDASLTASSGFFDLHLPLSQVTQQATEVMIMNHQQLSLSSTMRLKSISTKATCLGYHLYSSSSFHDVLTQKRSKSTGMSAPKRELLSRIRTSLPASKHCFGGRMWARWSFLLLLILRHSTLPYPTPMHFKSIFSVPAAGLLMPCVQSLVSRSLSSRFFLP